MTKKRAGNSSPAGKVKKKYPKIFYLVFIVVPILLLIILETGLRIAGYGKDLTQWVKFSETQYILNPEIAYRYFYNTTSVPSALPNYFDIEKAENTIRIFILGESSTAGFPYHMNGAFSNYIKKRLELLYPQKKIEIVNLGMAAINSYTLIDLIPGVIEQKPDLILIYTGHNEFYGALGIGSIESLGNSRLIVNSMLYLNKFRISSLVRDIVKSLADIFKDDTKRGTLMARMAAQQSIILDSEIFIKGTEQFEENLSDILKILKENNIPVIIGTLTSNLKDQAPFISVKDGNLPSALDVFNEAIIELNNGDTIKAKELFIYAKDLDALRFRAPDRFNKIIEKLSSEYRMELIDINSAFNNKSHYGITGNNLMTDHLHPNLEGYQLIGRLFTDKMLEKNLLPFEKTILLTNEEQDSIVINSYDFTNLDSIIARYKIITLKSDWPYRDIPKSTSEILKEINALNYEDSLALKVVDNKLSWEEAHRELAIWFLAKTDIENFLKEMNVLIYQFPVIPDYYRLVSFELLKKEMYKEAYPYLQKYHSLKPDAYSAKWLGIISLSENNISEAINYMEISLRYNRNDPQVLFNLAGAYSLQKDYNKALEKINECLIVDSSFPEAEDLKAQLVHALKVTQ